MNIGLLQFWDEWLGRLLCFLFTCVRNFVGLFCKVKKSEPKKILFVKLVEKGATVLAYSAFIRAIDRVGKDNVYLLVFSDNVDIARALNVLKEENIMVIDNKSLFAAILDILRVLYNVRRIGIDAIIDLEFFSKMTAAFCFLLGGKIRVGLHAFYGGGPYRGNLFTHRLLYSIDLHTRQIYESLVEALDCDPAVLPAMTFRPTDDPQYFARYAVTMKQRSDVASGILSEVNVDSNRPLILLNPYVSDELPFRRWPKERYVLLADKLLELYENSVICLIGTKRDLEPNEILMNEIGPARCKNIAGKTDLDQLLAVFEEADLLITSDGGASHIASLTSIEVITMFGPETPRLFAAETKRNHVIYAGLACSPSLNAFNNRKCPLPTSIHMDVITVEEVFQRAVSILNA